MEEGAVIRSSTNGMAIASLVLGIFWMWGLGSVLALIFGIKARRQIDWSGGTQGGRGLATAGIVLGIIGIVGAVIVVAVVIAGAAHSSSPQGY